MLVLRQPPELSARKGRKSPCVPGRDNQQKNKWACVCHPDPENRSRGRAFHDPGCIRAGLAITWLLGRFTFFEQVQNCVQKRKYAFRKCYELVQLGVLNCEF
mmetsp:Transcript_29747/g.104619  ORF Transcript_29747/g.104619 Transcript_29747/m.104619 type:complete len:102 (+) Transcript_29747:1338-1643(+)